MKIKYSLIPFIPAALAMLFFKLMGLFGVDGNGEFMGMNGMRITYTVIGIAVGLFVLCVLMNLFDRKTAPVYPVKRNIPTGILSMLSGVGILAGSLSAAAVAWADRANTENLLMILICAMLSLPAGIAMMVISRVHLSGRSTISSISVLFVFPSIWGCAELVNEFLLATKASIAARDLTQFFCYIFISLFLFSNSMVVSRIKGRNPVKGLFIYGLPMVALCLTFGAYELARQSVEGFDTAAIYNAIMLIVLALYAFSFIIEVFNNTYTKDELEIVDSIPVTDEDDFSEVVAVPVKGDYDFNDTRRKKKHKDSHRRHRTAPDPESMIVPELDQPVVISSDKNRETPEIDEDFDGAYDDLVMSSSSDSHREKPDVDENFDDAYKDLVMSSSDSHREKPDVDKNFDDAYKDLVMSRKSADDPARELTDDEKDNLDDYVLNTSSADYDDAPQVPQTMDDSPVFIPELQFQKKNKKKDKIARKSKKSKKEAQAQEASNPNVSFTDSEAGDSGMYIPKPSVEKKDNDFSGFGDFVITDSDNDQDFDEKPGYDGDSSPFSDEAENTGRDIPIDYVDPYELSGKKAAEQREERYRETRGEVNRLLRELGNKK